jgi:anaerobic selenocysteine-containing dehydrogenase
MLVEVEDGKLKSVGGDKDNPDSQGFLCVRGRSTNEIFGNPRRLPPKFVMIAARRPGAARVGMRR